MTRFDDSWTLARKEPHHGWIEVITGQHVQRQERRADPPPAPRADRPAEGADLRRSSTTATATTTSCRTATCGSRRSAVQRPTSCVQRVAEDTEVVGIDEGQFFDPNLPAACNTLADRRQARHRGRPGSGLPRPAVRADASAAGDRRSTSRRRSPSASSAAIRPTTRSGSWRAATACWSARAARTRRAAATASIRRWRSRREQSDMRYNSI